LHRSTCSREKLSKLNCAYDYFGTFEGEMNGEDQR